MSNKKSKLTLCPRCKINYYHYRIPEMFPALSRRDSKTNICRPCGITEALIDNGAMKADAIENDFVRLIQARAKKGNKKC